MNMQKIGNGNGKTSSTSISSTSMELSKRQALATDNKIEGGGNESKNIKIGESSNSVLGNETGAGQSQESSVKETTINELRPEMLLQILKCVDTGSLFKCRLVNYQWSENSTRILRNRPDARIRFEFNGNKFWWVPEPHDFSRQRKWTLLDFLKCTETFVNCPYSHFAFTMTNKEGLCPSEFFEHRVFKKFLSDFSYSSKKIRGLDLTFGHLKFVNVFSTLTKQLRVLLLHKIPHLEEFSLDIHSSIDTPQVKLFPNPKQTKMGTNSNGVQVPVQLPNLKMITFKAPMISSYTQILRDFLNAAVNLKVLSMTIYSPEDFNFLHSLGKLHLLKEATIELHTDFFSATESDKTSAPLPLPKLEILELRTNKFESESASVLWSQATNFLGNLFESSKDTLTEFKTHPIGFFPVLQLPTFTKLRKLDLTQCIDFPRQIFLPGIRTRDVFPAVSELDLSIGDWDSAFPQEDSIPVLPSIQSLILSERMYEKFSIPMVALMCPNLKKLKIKKHDRLTPKLKLLKGGRSIWTHMKQLESLEIDVDVDSPKNISYALDSYFTGISLENCQRLVEMVEAKKTLEKWGSGGWIPESELTGEREHPSILDMKDLETLTLNPYSGKTLLKRMDFFTRLTWISEEYAFKFLPHLKPTPTEEDLLKSRLLMFDM